MLFAIIFALALVAVAIKEAYFSDYSFWGESGPFGKTILVIFTPVILLVAACIGCLVGGVLALAIGFALPREWTPPARVELATLRSTDGVSGRFYLGSGHIDSELVYVFYTQDGTAVRPHSLKASNADLRVLEDQQASAYYTWRQSVFAEKWFDWIGINLSAPIQYEFHVPAGTIKRDYVLQ